MGTPGRQDSADLNEPALLRLSIDQVREGIQVIGFDWTYRYVNAAAARQSGRAPETLIGRTMESCYPGISQSRMFQALKRAMETRVPARIENDFSIRDQSRSYELRIEPVDEGILVLSLDITDQKETERQLRHAQRMEAIGRLAGGVAHDFNNLLTAIMGYSELALDSLGESEAAADVREIQKAAQRAARLTRQLLAFSRQQGVNREVLDLAAVLEQLEPMLARLMPDVEVTVDAGDRKATIQGDQGQIEQMILNLAVNARDAMPGGGRLRLAVDIVDVAQNDAERHGVVAGPHAAIVVQDTGSGMDADVMAHAFEPFFTTKPPGEGTGIGLATVSAIVQQTGGFLTVESHVGQGTTFTIYLPMTAAVDDGCGVEMRGPQQSSARRVLVAEPDADVADLIEKTLRRAGHDVLVARTAAEAMEMAAGTADLDLLVTDFMLPGLHGAHLAQSIVPIQPNMRVLYVSGFPDTRAVQSQGISPRIAYLAKPFTPADLIRRIDEVLVR